MPFFHVSFPFLYAPKNTLSVTLKDFVSVLLKVRFGNNLSNTDFSLLANINYASDKPDGDLWLGVNRYSLKKI